MASELDIVVFVGPTLQSRDVAAVCNAVCLPPAAQGDVYRVALQRPRAIGIVDGYFSGAPSVWHKEILWALSRGIDIFGSASMGALRAAELYGFGMRGVGRIFEAFRDGVLEDDDEVALVHGPAEAGFVQLSEPMVNIRATLARAAADGIISDSSRQIIENVAKALFFPRRNWATIFDEADRQGVDRAEVAGLKGWLPDGRIDQKREDALEMLAEMNAPAQSTPSGALFDFEWTSHWDAFVARTAYDVSLSEPILGPQQRAILDELRLEAGESYAQVRDRALLRYVGDREAGRKGLEASPDAARARLRDLRASQGLFNRTDVDSWLRRNHLSPAAFERLIEEDVRAQAAIGASETVPDRVLLDELRLSGAYERLDERARRKQSRLATAAQDALKEEPPADVLSLRRWYFEHCLQRSLPDDVVAAARERGFADLDQFDRVILNEWLYTRAIKD